MKLTDIRLTSIYIHVAFNYEVFELQPPMYLSSISSSLTRISRPRTLYVPPTNEPPPRGPATGGINVPISTDPGAEMYRALENMNIGGPHAQLVQPQGGRQSNYYFQDTNPRFGASSRPIITYLSWQDLTKFRSPGHRRLPVIPDSVLSKQVCNANSEIV